MMSVSKEGSDLFLFRVCWNLNIGNNSDLGPDGKHTTFLSLFHISGCENKTEQKRSSVSYPERNAWLTSRCAPESFSSSVPQFVLARVRFHSHWVRVVFLFSSPLLKLILLLLLLLALPVLFYFGTSRWRIPIFKDYLLVPIFREIIVLHAWLLREQFTN